MWTDLLLELRPTNVMHQLGIESRVPVLNARDLLVGLDDTDAALWMPTAKSDAEIEGLLRAASHSKAPLGLSMFVNGDLSRFQHEHPVGSLVWKTSQLAKTMSVCPPLCFHVQMPLIDHRVDSEVDSACTLMMACVDAGFTSFGLDLRGCSHDDDFSWAFRVLTPVVELELSQVVILDFSQEGNPQGVVEGLRSAGVYPDMVLITGESEGLVGSEALVEFFADNPGLKPGWMGDSISLPRGFFTASLGEWLLADEPAQEHQPKTDVFRREAKTYTRALIRFKRLGLKGTVEHIASRLVAR